MRPLWKDVLLSLLMGFVVPWVLLNFAVLMLEKEPPPVIAETTATETVPDQVSLPVRLRNGEGNTTDEDMDSYLVGVVLGEMPTSFEEEALKAQAVVARTYARKAWVTGGKHGDGSLCTDAGCCQAWISEEEYLARGGRESDVDKVRSAVAATSGWVLTYAGELIEATYFSCSGGTTEDAVAVWGTDFPYLRSVDSPGEESAAYHEATVYFAPAELEAALGITLSGEAEDWLGQVTRTAGGGVATMDIGGKTFSGTELRALLGLRSTAFTMTVAEDAVTVTTRGWGHRVGMSQYGADAMAAAGSGWQEILAHYYPGTVPVTAKD